MSLAVAASFFCGTVFHALALTWPALASSPTPSWRHGLFLAIDGAYAAGFAARIRWLVWAVLPLAVQQVVSHGTDLLAARAAGHTDAQSALVLAAMPAFVAVAWLCRRETPKAPGNAE